MTGELSTEQRMERLAALPAHRKLMLLDWLDVQAPGLIDHAFDTILVPERCGRCSYEGQGLVRRTAAGVISYWCLDLNACHRRAHHPQPPCAECGGAYPGHDLHCPLRPAGRAK